MIDDAARTTDDAAFETFFRATEPVLGRALAAGFGFETGHDATAVALAYAWRNWSRIRAMQNPRGYLYRIGENWAKRQFRRRPPVVSFPSAGPDEPAFEPALAPALATLPRRQRQVVVLVAAYGLSHREAADLLGVGRSSIQNHVERGLAHLRAAIGAPE